MPYELIGTAAMLLHFAFFGYVVLGGFLAWRYPRALWVHLAVAAYALGIVLIEWPCVLTELENRARLHTGREVMENGFIDHYLTGVLYPREHLLTSRIVIAAVIAASWAGAVHRLRPARAAAAPEPAARV
ncbi:DUF2784 domain-containing protein [Nocardiopsis sp. CNT-189]|uniref:DUF2784 domain-containing protein n=1 Tax=Nocardiopsis oceanisediminis TaxID=2816862 RepID=UPI003B34C528